MSKYTRDVKFMCTCKVQTINVYSFLFSFSFFNFLGVGWWIKSFHESRNRPLIDQNSNMNSEHEVEFSLSKKNNNNKINK